MKKIINQLINIENQRIPEGDSLVGKKIKKIQEDSEVSDFRIAIIGEFSVGKSTFINALLGRRILTSRNTEATATITRINNVTSNNNKENTYDVVFTDDTETLSMSLDKIDEISHYTTKSEGYDVASKVSHVDVYLNIGTETPFSIIDTPGLNGLSPKHVEMTLKEIERAHVCVFLTDIKGVSNSNLDIINHINASNTETLVVVNQIDRINKSEGETKEGKIEEVTNTIKKYYPDLVFDSFAVSSETVLKQKLQKEYNDENFMILEKELSSIYSKTTEIKLKQHHKALEIIAEKINYNLHKEIDLLEIKIGDKSNSISKNINQLSGNDKKRLDLISRKLEHEKAVLLPRLNQIWEHDFDIHVYVKKVLLGVEKLDEFYTQQASIINDIKKELKLSFNKFSEIFISEFKEIEVEIIGEVNTMFYINNNETSLNLNYILGTSDNIIDADVNDISSKINVLENDFKEIDKQKINKENELKVCKSNLESNLKELKGVDIKVDSEKSSCNKRKRSLGLRPTKEIINKTESCGFLWLSSREVFSHYDDSRGEEWEEDLEEIESSNRQNISFLNNRRNEIVGSKKRLNKEILSLDDSISSLKFDFDDKKEEYEQLQELKISKLRYIEVKKLNVKKQQFEHHINNSLKRVYNLISVSVDENMSFLMIEVEIYYKKQSNNIITELNNQQKSLSDSESSKRLKLLKNLLEQHNKIQYKN